MATEKKSSISQVNGKFIDTGKANPSRGPPQNTLEGKTSIGQTLKNNEKSKSTDSLKPSKLRISSQRNKKNSGIEDEDELSPTLPELGPEEELPDDQAIDPPSKSPPEKIQAINEDIEEDLQSVPSSKPSHRPKQNSIMTIDQLMASSKPDLEG